MPDPSKLPPAPEGHRSACPIACGLDLLGDKWTLLVIRDLFIGREKYNEFLASPEGIPTNILADRLKKLEQQGIVSRELYSERPPRASYHLTQKGRGLWPVLKELGKWTHQHVEGSVKMPHGD